MNQSSVEYMYKEQKIFITLLTEQNIYTEQKHLTLSFTQQNIYTYTNISSFTHSDTEETAVNDD